MINERRGSHYPAAGRSYPTLEQTILKSGLLEELRPPVFESTRVSSSNRDLVQGLAWLARSRPGIAPAHGVPTAGWQSLHSAVAMPHVGIFCTDQIRAASALHSPGVRLVAASPAPLPRQQGIHLGQQ